MNDNQMGDIIQKAWDDKSFKKLLIENPVTAIQETLGMKVTLPEGKRLVVTDQTSEDEIHITIPRMPAEQELTEDQLDVVAGGTTRSPFDLDGGTGPYNPLPDIIITTW